MQKLIFQMTSFATSVHLDSRIVGLCLFVCVCVCIVVFISELLCYSQMHFLKTVYAY